MRIAAVVLVVLALAAVARRAAACPCCEPCGKYDRLMREPPPAPLADAYVRARPLVLPAHPRSRDVMAVLAGARFVPATAGASTLHLIDGAHVPATIDHADGARVVIVHALALARGRFRIDVDGTAFAVSPCRDDHARATVCLERVAR